MLSNKKGWSFHSQLRPGHENVGNEDKAVMISEIYFKKKAMSNNSLWCLFGTLKQFQTELKMFPNVKKKKKGFQSALVCWVENIKHTCLHNIE